MYIPRYQNNRSWSIQNLKSIVFMNQTQVKILNDNVLIDTVIRVSPPSLFSVFFE